MENTTADMGKFTHATESGLGEALRSGALCGQLLSLAIYGWLVMTAVRTALRDAGQWWSDVLRALHALARLLGLKALVAGNRAIMPAKGPSGEVPTHGWRPTLILVLGVGRWVLAIVAAVSLAVVLYAMWKDR